MTWTTTAYYHTPQVQYLYDVELIGWPHDIVPFGTQPYRIRSLDKLTKLVRRLESGEMRFERRTEEEMEALAQRCDHMSLFSCKRNVGRMDTGSRPLRPLATRSKKLRKYERWSSRLVNGRED